MTLKELQNDNDFHLCASSDLLNAKADAYFNPGDLQYCLVVDNETIIGPLSKRQLEALLHVGKDAFEDSKSIG